jgi:hypothetical protein
MKTTSSPQNVGPENDRTSEQGIEGSIAPNRHEVNITDGGEFLDDAIRMKDQPLQEASKKPLQKFSYKHLF